MLRREKGFTLIELLIVIAIIGILAAIAIPMYQAQTVKARMTEVTNAISNISSAIGARMNEDPNWPNPAIAFTTAAEIQAEFGLGLTALTRVAAGGWNVAVPLGAVVNGGTINIGATLQGCGNPVDGSIVEMTGTINADGSISWLWATNSTVPAAYIPRQ